MDEVVSLNLDNTLYLDTLKSLYILKEKFVDYKTCQEYVEENLYFRKDKDVGIFYKIDTKEYQVMLTYCKPVDKQ